MQQIDLERFAGYFTAGQKIGRDRLHGGIVGIDFELLLCVFVLIALAWILLCMIQHNGDEGFSFDFGGLGE